MAVLFQVGHQGLHLLLGGAVLEDHPLPGARLGALGAGRGGGGGLLGRLAQDVGGNHHPLNLIGALVDGGDLGVPVEPLHLHALEVAAAAENLEGVVCDLQGNVGGVLLGHGGLHAVGDVCLLQLGGGVDQEPGAAQLGGHISDLKGDVLLLADGLSELNTLLGVLHGGLIGPLGDAQRLGRDADAPAVQGGHGDLEALALLAQQVLLGNLHVVEIQLAGGGRADAHLVIVLLKGKALPALFHDKGGDAPRSDTGGGDGEHHIGAGLAAVGDEYLLEEVVVPHALGGGLGAAGVRAGVGLGEAEGPQFFAGAEVGQIFFLLLLGAEGVDGVGAQRGMGGQDDARAAVHPGQLLHGDGVAQSVQPRAPVLLLIGQAHQAQLPHLLYGLSGELVVLVQHEGNGLDLRLGKLPYLGPQFLMLLCGLIQHTDSSSFMLFFLENFAQWRFSKLLVQHPLDTGQLPAQAAVPLWAAFTSVTGFLAAVDVDSLLQRGKHIVQIQPLTRALEGVAPAASPAAAHQSDGMELL